VSAGVGHNKEITAMRRRCGASDPEHFAAVHLAPLGRVDQREKGLLIGVQRNCQTT